MLIHSCTTMDMKPVQAIRHDKFAAYVFIYFYPNVQDRPDHSSKTFWGRLKITHFHDWACEMFKDYEHDYGFRSLSTSETYMLSI